MTDYLIQHYLDESFKRFPDKVAAASFESEVNFEKLYEMSNKLANCFVSIGVSRQDRVVFYLNRSVNILIAINGILKADAVYVPIDARSPIHRMKKIVHDCEPKVVVTDEANLEKVDEMIGTETRIQTILVMGYRDSLARSFDDRFVFSDQIDAQSSAYPEYLNVDTDLASILYTSGSTGDPKGVMISHLNIRNYIDWAVDCFDISQCDNILNTAPFHFDMSTFDIFCSMKSGGTLFIAPLKSLLFPGDLIEFIDKNGITVWKAISSLLMYVARTAAIKSDRLKTLKKILFSGEVLPTKHLIQWMTAYPDKIFYHAYGPTEATGISTYYRIDEIPKDPSERIPIGRPCSNTEVFSLKEDYSLAGIEEHGELCIRGSGLSLGYWNDEEKTAERFIRNPLSNIMGDRVYRTGDIVLLRKDGNYEFIGRKDDQVKWMGYRIELHEIVKALLSMKHIKDAAVLMCESPNSNDLELVAFIEAVDDQFSSEVKAELCLRLPFYMVPKQIISIERMPRTDRGKINRDRLKKYFTLKTTGHPNRQHTDMS